MSLLTPPEPVTRDSSRSSTRCGTPSPRATSTGSPSSSTSVHSVSPSAGGCWADLRGHAVDCSAVGRLGSTHAEPRRRARREVRGDCRRLREGEPPARRGGRGGSRRRACVGGRSRFRRSRDSSPLRSEGALPRRLDHEDLHGHRDHAAARRGQARPRRSCGRAPPRARGRAEPARSHRGAHDQTDALARVRPPERAPRHELVGRRVRGRPRPDARARGGDRDAGSGPHAMEVLEPRLPAPRRGRLSRVGHPVPGIHPLEDLAAARDDVDVARPTLRSTPRAACDGVRAALSLRRARPCTARGERLRRGGRPLVVRRGPRALARVSDGGRARDHREGHAEGDAQGSLSHRRRVDECVVHRLVRAATATT